MPRFAANLSMIYTEHALFDRQDHAHEIVMEVGAPNLKVQMDLYPCRIVEGDLATKIGADAPTGRIGCEYRPRDATAPGLGWFQPYRGRT